jgi:hypothetical protein
MLVHVRFSQRLPVSGRRAEGEKRVVVITILNDGDVKLGGQLTERHVLLLTHGYRKVDWRGSDENWRLSSEKVLEMLSREVLVRAAFRPFPDPFLIDSFHCMTMRWSINQLAFHDRGDLHSHGGSGDYVSLDDRVQMVNLMTKHMIKSR